jgi:serine protease Do
MVLDGAVEPPFGTFDELATQMAGFDSAFTAYTQDCLDSGDCPFDGPLPQALAEAHQLILSVDGKVVERSAQLPGVISSIKPGNDARLEVWRDHASKTLTVKIEELQEEKTQKVSNRDVEEPAKADKLGLSVRPLGADERKSAETEGYLLVEDVTGAAAQAGVRPGDVILGVNGKPVKSLTELKNATASTSKTVALLLEREGTQVFIAVRGS